MKPYYITTPIYYPNDKLHIGNAYCTVAADCIARYKRLRGYDVKFITGTDEHGQKIEKAAKEAGLAPMDFLDGIVAWIKELWKTMDISNDFYIRTTDDFHVAVIQKIFKRLYEQGDIYKGSYEGKYCLPCETFFTERQLVDGNCPECGRPVGSVREEAYFFKMSKYADRLIKYYEDNPDFIVPRFRKNEMLQNFLLPGLEDLCVSRTSFKWGVPVDFDPAHVVYVWIDALSNYITALGYWQENDADFKKFWPADVHFVGKDIIRFHTIIWPIILMALDLPLPKQVFVHGFYTVEADKISKSKGNAIDPNTLVKRYGVDAVRYFLLKELPYGQDGDYSLAALLQRINSDLANDLGNLLSRTIGMIKTYFNGKLPAERSETPFDAELISAAKAAVSETGAALDEFRFTDAINAVWALIRRANKYCDETQPWVLIKDEAKKPELAGVMRNLREVLRICAVLITPFMPNTPAEIFAQMNIADEALKTWDSIAEFNADIAGEVSVSGGKVIFPRLDIKKELAESAAAVPEKPKAEQKPEITIDDFARLDLRVGEIMDCEVLKGSDKLLKSQVKIGGETVQILSGIAKHYAPEDMKGKKVVVVKNLKPAKIRGEMSFGMVLAASGADGVLRLVSPDGEIESGAEVS